MYYGEEMKKVLCVDTFVPGYAPVFGDRIHTIELASFLKDKGFKLDIIGLNPFKGVVDVKGVHYKFHAYGADESIRATDHPGEFAHTVLQLNALLVDALYDSVQYDGVHLHTELAFPAVRTLTTHWGVPFLFTQHTVNEDQLLHSGCNQISAGFLIALQREAIRESFKWFVPSTYAANRNKKWGEVDVPVIVPHTVRISDRRKMRYEAHDPFRILSVGRLDRVKNPELVLKIVAALGKSVEIIFAGDGYLMTQLKRDSRRLGVNAIFLGNVDRELLGKVYTEADILLCCTRQDTFNLVVSEAMHMGLPVIVAGGTGLEDRVKDGVNGCIVKEDASVETWVLTIRELIAHPELRKRLGMRAVVDSCTKTTTWDAYCDEYVKAFGQ